MDISETVKGTGYLMLGSNSIVESVIASITTITDTLNTQTVVF